MPEESTFNYSNFFDDSEIHNLIQSHIINHLEIHAAKPPTPREVPLPPADWCNREPELKRLQTELTSGDWDEVAFTGPEGAGKTALASMLAHRLVERFCDAQLYIDLEDGDVKTALRSALGRLGVPKAFLLDSVPGLRSQFMSMTRDKAVLVVVEDAPSREAALLFKPESRSGAFLALGHQWTEGHRALVHPVRDLTAEHAREYLRRACPELSDEEIDEHVAGLEWRPVHLQRLAGMVRAWQQAESEQERRALVAEYSTEQMVDATCQALSESAAWLYRFLSALPGDEFERAVLKVVSVGDEVLGELVESRLVAETLPGRYRVKAGRPPEMPGSVDLEAALHRVVLYYLKRAQLADLTVMGERRLRLAQPVTYLEVPEFESSEAALTWLDDNRHELLAAVDMADIHGWHVEKWSLAEALWPLFTNLPYPELAVRCYRTALDHLTDPKAKARILICLGRALVDLREYAESRSTLTEAIELALEDGDDVLVCSAKEQLGWLFYKQGRLAAAEATYLEGLELADRIDRKRTKALLLKLLGLIHRDRGEHNRARECFARAVRGFLDVADPRNSVIVRFELAVLDVADHGERFRDDADTMIEHLRGLRQWKPVADALQRLGAVLGDQDGQDRINEAKEIYERFGVER